MKLNDKDSIQLHNALLQFKDITLKLIVLLEQEDFDALEGLFEERQELINTMDNLHYNKETFKEICEGFEIIPLQQKLTLLLSQNKTRVKNELEKVRATKIANKSYNKGYKVDPLFFNRKI